MKHEENYVKAVKCYRPAQSIISLMQGLLRLEVEERERSDKELAGAISFEDANKEREKAEEERKILNTRKVEVLNTKIFPAMANLTTFLEAILVSSDLHEIFDEDLKALFFAESTNDRQSDKQPIIKRFITASMMWPISKETEEWFINDDGEKRRKRKTELLPNYRFIVCEWMQMAILEMIKGGIGQYIFKNETFLNNVLYQDMDRAASWIKLLADGSHRNLKFNAKRRPALF
jgi:hypothetical protein